MRIVWISHGGGPVGGAELGMWEAINGLVRKGVEVHTVLPWQADFAGRLEGSGLPVHIVPFTWWVGLGQERKFKSRVRRTARNLLLSRKVAEYLRQVRPDVVVSNSIAIGVGALAAKLARVPHVWYIHELFGGEGHGLYFDLGERLSLSLMDRLSEALIVNSRTVQEKFAGRITADKLRLIYFGVEVPARPARSRGAGGTLNLIHVGALTPGKRQEDAVGALALLVRKGADVRLTLLGEETRSYGAYLRGLCQGFGIEGRVDFVPFSNDPFSYIAAADCLVMCSRGEAFGRVTVEAMKLGRPVVGADSGGTAELVRDGANGLLFRLGDPQDLASKIETLYHDRGLLEELGRRAQVWATEKFSPDVYASELYETLQSVMKTR